MAAGSTNSISAIGFDADDTLWRHADLYLEAEKRLAELSSDREAPAGVIKHLRGQCHGKGGAFQFGR